MIKGLQWIVICVFLITATNCSKEETPYQLSDEKLVDILSDLHISESATQHLSLAFRDSMVLVYLDQILEIHEVPKEIFEPAYQKLKRDPQKLQIIYGKVIKRLDNLKVKKKAEKDDNEKATKKNVRKIKKEAKKK